MVLIMEQYRFKLKNKTTKYNYFQMSKCQCQVQKSNYLRRKKKRFERIVLKMFSSSGYYRKRNRS
jgi:predicted AAA+ superfamily ATPase